MKIDGSEFGAVTIDGTTYTRDVIIRLSGAVEKRKKKLSRGFNQRLLSSMRGYCMA